MSNHPQKVRNLPFENSNKLVYDQNYAVKSLEKILNSSTS
mgnify:CR=1 FL=1